MKVLDGIRVIEVAQWGFVPSAGAVLSDWGAQVLKIEHPTKGDPIRGLDMAGVKAGTSGFTLMWEVCNRGKRSVGLDVAIPEGREMLLRLVDDADVFLSSYLPDARAALGIDVDDIRGRNPRIVYGRGSGHGPLGDEATKGGFDAISFWSRGGAAASLTPADSSALTRMPAPGFGDLLSGLTLAGAVAAALVHRERTGEGTVVDVSLLSTAAWGMQASVAGSRMLDLANIDWPPPPRRPGNPLAHAYRTADGRFVVLNFLQPDRYWTEFCNAVGRPELVDDPRLASAAARLEHLDHTVSVLEDLFASRTLAEWEAILAGQDGQWDVARTPREVSDDPQVLANRYVQTVDYGDGRSISLAAAPGQFGVETQALRPAPALGVDTDEVLGAVGVDTEELIELKLGGVIT